MTPLDFVRRLASREPVLTAASATAAVAGAIAGLFGVDAAAVAAVIGPIVAGVFARRKVSPSA